MPENNQHNLNKYSPTAIAREVREQDTSKNLAMTIAAAADDRKAGDIIILGVEEVSYIADYFTLVTGYSKAQVRAISDSIQAKVEQGWQRRPLRIEGKTEGSWVLLDYGEVIVHIMLPQEREYYNLEAFWGHAEKLEFSSLEGNGSN
ncbi:MAG: ribosome silencing factor [Oscillatoria sp. PMC 1068.18]|nr:ribosome silencing factor [Oscillatoria sp. PMC 1076.18]MEC4988662.1 ribosome silencing factor [Oscillatoria sp. PMC 1068.18]